MKQTASEQQKQRKSLAAAEREENHRSGLSPRGRRFDSRQLLTNCHQIKWEVTKLHGPLRTRLLARATYNKYISLKKVKQYTSTVRMFIEPSAKHYLG